MTRGGYGASLVLKVIPMDNEELRLREEKAREQYRLMCLEKPIPMGLDAFPFLKDLPACEKEKERRRK